MITNIDAIIEDISTSALKFYTSDSVNDDNISDVINADIELTNVIATALDGYRQAIDCGLIDHTPNNDTIDAINDIIKHCIKDICYNMEALGPATDVGMIIALCRNITTFVNRIRSLISDICISLVSTNMVTPQMYAAYMMARAIMIAINDQNKCSYIAAQLKPILKDAIKNFMNMIAPDK